jgi:hypothetical protein
MADVVDLDAYRERREQQVRILTDIVRMKLAGHDITAHLEALASLELFSEFREVA